MEHRRSRQLKARTVHCHQGRCHSKQHGGFQCQRTMQSRLSHHHQRQQQQQGEERTGCMGCWQSQSCLYHRHTHCWSPDMSWCGHCYCMGWWMEAPRRAHRWSRRLSTPGKDCWMDCCWRREVADMDLRALRKEKTATRCWRRGWPPPSKGSGCHRRSWWSTAAPCTEHYLRGAASKQRCQHQRHRRGQRTARKGSFRSSMGCWCSRRPSTGCYRWCMGCQLAKRALRRCPRTGCGRAGSVNKRWRRCHHPSTHRGSRWSLACRHMRRGCCCCCWVVRPRSRPSQEGTRSELGADTTYKGRRAPLLAEGE